ncbi:quinol dehydrogenase ferredoxin subunit NapH [Parasulfuritortus cantonensis]|uniref:Quinol dehydrogenase ferredoxin subunit NapH n=1 Tax=Parasulfuritortus cantonensis TaxID=2528202 RepID=A0A4R1BH47_9PROT|nr:quinol dehydrogenase ferredoxin subunit NapH [Parasulfuritortus cantonensis]TCJ16521.1 quinol dehydrogenase ferredoxin subunit NapH [Parasulfuritortus cantonensis]
MSTAADLSHDKLEQRSFPARLWSWRYIVLRRLVQLGILMLFFGTAHWAWEYPAKTPLLTGNLSASEFIGMVPMADPFATLQIFLTGHVLQGKVILGSAIVLGFYLLLGGRVFCAWVCPVNMVTDLAGWLRARLPIPAMFHVNRNIRYFVLAASLVLSALTGLAAFEWVSPVGMMHREIIFGFGAGIMALAAIFLFDLLILKNGWCGHLCPLGAFWSLVGRTAQVRVRYDKDSCTHCGECAKVCPEPQVLNLKHLERTGVVDSGECSNCGRCTPLCPEGSLAFDLRLLIRKPGADKSVSARRTK